MTVLHSQDRDHTYEYTGQALYSSPVLSPRGTLWGFNLHLEDAAGLLGTFDSLTEIMAEIAAIGSTDALEWFVSGYSDYNGTEDFMSLCAIVDGMTDDEYSGYESD